MTTLALADVCTVQQQYIVETGRTRRVVTLRLQMRIRPYARQTGMSRFKGGRDGDRIRTYNAFIQDARWAMRLALQTAGVEGFSTTQLRLSGTIRVPHRVSSTSDLSNLIKAIEDAGNGCLWDDDRWVYEYGAWSKVGVRRDEELGCTIVIEELA